MYTCLYLASDGVGREKPLYKVLLMEIILREQNAPPTEKIQIRLQKNIKEKINKKVLMPKNTHFLIPYTFLNFLWNRYGWVNS